MNEKGVALPTAMIVLVVLALLFFIFVLGIAMFGIAAHSTPTPVPSG